MNGENGLGIVNEALNRLNEKIAVYIKKLEVFDRKCERRRDNRNFELFPGRFYKSLDKDEETVHGVPIDEIKNFWSAMWCPREENDPMYSEYLGTYHPGTTPKHIPETR